MRLFQWFIGTLHKGIGARQQAAARSIAIALRSLVGVEYFGLGISCCEKYQRGRRCGMCQRPMGGGEQPCLFGCMEFSCLAISAVDSLTFAPVFAF